MAGGGRQHRCAAEQVGEAVPEVGAERHHRRPGLLDRLGARGGRDRRHHGPYVGLVGAAGVQPGPHPGRDRVGAVRATVTRPMVATAPRAVAASRADSTAAASRSIGSSRSTSRVVPAWLASPSRSSRHRPCGQMPLGDADRQRPRRPGRGPARRAARPGCRPGAASRRRGRAARDPARPRASPRPAWCRRRRSSDRARSASSAPVSSREPAQAMPNRAPSSSVKLTTPSGRAGTTPCSRIRSTRGERADDAERAVVGTAVGHRVQVAARHDPGAVGVGVAPPRPLVAVAVHDEVQAAPRGLAGEPLAAGQVGWASRRAGGSRRSRASRPTGSRSAHIPSMDAWVMRDTVGWQDHPLARPRSAAETEDERCACC